MDPRSSASHEAPASEFAGDASKPVRKRRHRWVWLVVLTLFGLLFYWVIQHQQKSQTAAMTGGGRRPGGAGAVPITVATARAGGVNIYMDAIGTVTALNTVYITAQVTGLVTAVHYREGQMVQKGDPLIEIDPRPFEATLQQAQGTLERDQSLLAEAQMDLTRYQQAWAKNAIPRQTMEDQEKIVLQEQGTVKNDEGVVKYDEVQLGYCHIISPLTGRVGLRLVDPGNLVTANSSAQLLVVTQMQPITVVFTLAEDNLPQVLHQTRGKQQLKVDALDRAQAPLDRGKLTSIDNQIDTTTGTVKLRAEFPNKNGVLFPNQFVNTRMLVSTLPDQVLIPSSAIQHNGNTDFVYVINNNKAEQRTVKTGISDNGETAVKGVKAGEVVANSSFEKLQNGLPTSLSKIKLPTSSDATTSSAP